MKTWSYTVSSEFTHYGVSFAYKVILHYCPRYFTKYLKLKTERNDKLLQQVPRSDATPASHYWPAQRPLGNN